MGSRHEQQNEGLLRSKKILEYSLTMPDSSQRVAIIIGAGPAGLTAAYELLERTDIKPIIFESTEEIGGISKTVNYKGNRMDIGGHRFFSKSDRVMDWWKKIMPLQGSTTGERQNIEIAYHRRNAVVQLDQNGPNPSHTDLVMLVRRRVSRIFYLRTFFDYPLKLNVATFSKLGIVRIIGIGISYVLARFFPIKQEKSLEDFFINRFGDKLYRTFFKDYTEKVWGVPCNEIKPEWGAQRIKGLSITKAIMHSLKGMVKKKDTSLSQKDTETSLIEQFMYPKYGPGQMWEEVLKIILSKGGEIYRGYEAIHLNNFNNNITEVTFLDKKSGNKVIRSGEIVFSTMPIKDLINSFDQSVPENVKEVSNGLIYRDFITVGILLKKLAISLEGKLIPDNWIYIQEKDVKIGRLQVFNNWSPYMVADPNTVWLGLEYFCYEGDELWSLTENELTELAIEELVKMKMIFKEDVLDNTVIKMPKTYPAYFGTYDRFEEIKSYINKVENLFLIGRNGMHKYNNQDHSMLTAMVAVDNIEAGITDKSNLWLINTEEEYHESK